jgi:hypothetical protein
LEDDLNYKKLYYFDHRELYLGKVLEVIYAAAAGIRAKKISPTVWVLRWPCDNCHIFNA